MSVLNQMGEEQVECPLCMEPLEVDDLNFFPCTCGYQICRFCWHRIRTDENGLCPACRKAYPEDPADFKPLTQEEVAKLKAEKRQKDQQRKQRITENRKHLANVRVVQRNLVFVVGLPMRLADAETLKKHEYFGKFGKIHKVVINQSTSYAGSQGPSASAYVTYHRSDDALRAIQAVNNIAVDGRTVKTSLGTTKYCSHFMKNQPCPKADCMYLHELGDPDASFTKEEMQQGKHQEYEKKLHEQLIANTLNRKPTPSPPTVPVSSQQPVNKEAWPSLHLNQNSSVIVGVAPSTSPPETSMALAQSNNNKGETKKSHNPAKHKHRNSSSEDNRKLKDSPSGLVADPLGLNGERGHDPSLEREGEERTGGGGSSPPMEAKRGSGGREGGHRLAPPDFPPHPDYKETNGFLERDFKFAPHIRNPDYTHHPPPNTIRQSTQTENHTGKPRPPTLFEPDNNSFFSSNFSKISSCNSGNVIEWPVNGVAPHMPDVLPQVHSSEDWQAAFGFPQNREEDFNGRDDDLGFDPFHETQKALAEMIEKEEEHHRYQPKILMHHNIRLANCSKLLEGLRISSNLVHARPPPPGFTSTPNHMNAFGLGIPRTGGKVLPFVHPTFGFQNHNSPQVWDWPSLDPAIVTSAQHCDLYAGNPPPGFTLRQTLDNL